VGFVFSMLDSLRKSAGSWVVKILFAILVLSFAVWGIGDIFRGPGRDTVVIEVGDRDITAQELITEYQRSLEQARRTFGETLDAETARRLGFLEGVIQTVVGRALFEAAAGDLGIAVSDDMVRETIREDPAFRGPGGVFDKFTFEQLVRQAGYSEEAYVAAMRRDLARGQLVSSIRAGATAPRVLGDSLYRLRQEKRIASTVLVADSAITGIGEPDEAALEAFHREQAARFTAPEFRALTVVSLDVERLAGEVAVAEEELRLRYDENPERFITPERRNVRQILLDDEDSARRAHERLQEGTEFAQVAKEVADKEEGDLVIGFVTREGLPEPLGEVAFALEEGGFGEPVESPLGWHVLQVSEIEPDVERSFEEARDELRAEVADERVIDTIFSLANQLEDALAGGASLEQAAARVDLQPIAIEALDRRGRDARGQAVEGLPGGDFLETAFSTAEGESSLLTDTPDGGYFMLRVDKVTPAALRPLDSIRSEVVEAWKAEQRHKAAEAQAQAIADRIKGGEALAELAAELGLEVTTTDPFTRYRSDLPPDLVAKLFAASVTGVATAESGEGYLVAQLDDIRSAEPGADQAGLEALGRELREAFAADLLAQYQAALYGRYAVDINNRAIDELF
jgi:peptidyl-prolyl cis-trans isomerase D